ncbi:hypothetical protein IJG27_02955 [Candidatus Saccharibacteria bacterium]|nr:hypothetical protein [Candidatus Saccharibacteria bacterium]
MRKIVKLFFTLILVSSVATIASFVTPVFAEETPQAPTPAETTTETTETPSETTEITGDEWDGIINEPANTPVEEPVTTAPTTVVITEVTTTVIPPATTNYTSTPRAKSTTSIPAQADAPVEAPAETPTAETTEIIPDDPNTTKPEPTETKASPISEDVEVPETSTPAFNETTRKITLLALTSTAIVYFLCIEIWGLKNLIKIHQNEKLLKTAKQKATEIGDAKISRSA